MEEHESRYSTVMGCNCDVGQLLLGVTIDYRARDFFFPAKLGAVIATQACLDPATAIARS